MRAPLVVVAAIALTTHLAHAGDKAIGVPPVEVDVGVGAPIGPDVATVGPSMEILAGLHWASLAWKPTRFDFGVGYVGSFRELDRPTIRALRGDVMAKVDDELRFHGGYLTLATTLVNQRHFRTWFAARGELGRAYEGDHVWSVSGAALRISTEVYASTAQQKNHSFCIGTVAIGVYAEASYRSLRPELGPHQFTTGISVRLPFTVIGS